MNELKSWIGNVTSEMRRGRQNDKRAVGLLCRYLKLRCHHSFVGRRIPAPRMAYRDILLAHEF